MRPSLGTFVEIGVLCAHEAHAQKAMSAAFSSIEQIHRRLSFQQSDSELTRLNTQPFQWVSVSKDAWRVLYLSKRLMQRSQHFFNCTLGGALIRRGVLPHHGGDFIDAGDERDIQLACGKVKLLRPIRICVDGMAKGYAVDRAIGVLKRHGVKTAWVNAGGDLRVYGDVTLPVQRRALNDQLSRPMLLCNQAMASSEIRAHTSLTKPGFLMNATGDSLPQKPELISVLAPWAWRADALTKVAACALPHQRCSIIRALGGECISTALGANLTPLT